MLSCITIGLSSFGLVQDHNIVTALARHNRRRQARLNNKFKYRETQILCIRLNLELGTVRVERPCASIRWGSAHVLYDLYDLPSIPFPTNPLWGVSRISYLTTISRIYISTHLYIYIYIDNKLFNPSNVSTLLSKVQPNTPSILGALP